MTLLAIHRKLSEFKTVLAIGHFHETIGLISSELSQHYQWQGFSEGIVP